MSGLLGSLGLDDIPADPNDVPDGRYVGTIFKDEFVVKSDDTVHHVITYKVTDGEHKGAQRPEWFKVGINPKREGPSNVLVGFDPAMEEQQKRWYKKRLVDLGLTDEQIANYKPGNLTGLPVIFGTKRNGNFVNVSFVERRDGQQAQAGANPETTATAPASQTQATDAITGQL